MIYCVNIKVHLVIVELKKVLTKNYTLGLLLKEEQKE